MDTKLLNTSLVNDDDEISNILEDTTGKADDKESIKLIKSTKPEKSISQEIYNKIKLISINFDNIHLYGSFQYRANPYPSDIDAFEHVEIPIKANNKFQIVANHLMKIAKKINDTPLCYMGDFKAGLDERYILDIGNIDGYNVKGYDYEKVLSQVNELKNKKLLNSSEYDEIKYMLKPKINFTEYQELYDLLRSKFIVRWTIDELMKGFKILTGGLKMTLEQAIQFKSPVKIDLWAPVNNKYVEITNYFILEVSDSKGNVSFMNVSDFDFTKSLKQEIYKYTTPKFFKPFKMLKRMWSLSRLSNNVTALELLTPIIRSDIGLINQIVSEIDTLIMILEKVKKPPNEIISNQIDNFKLRLSNVVQFNIDLNEINSMVDSILKSSNKIKKLEELYDYLKDIVDKKTIEKLNKIGYNPPPKEFLPDSITGGNIIIDVYKRIKGFLSGVRPFAPPKVRDFLNKYGSYIIKSIKVCRNPINQAISTLLNTISLGRFNEVKKKLGHDDLYHLFLVINIYSNGEYKNIIVEKNHVFNIDYYYSTPSDYMEVIIDKTISLSEFIYNGQKYQGSSFWKYDPIYNNCQVAIMSLLKGSNLGNEQVYKFVKQDVKELLRKYEYKFADSITDFAGRLDRLIFGNGLN